jgi:uncharacterized protein
MLEKIFIENDKGLKLAAIVEKPEMDGKFPAVILLHGLSGHKDQRNYTSLAEELQKAGMASIRFDYSGFAESEGSLEVDYKISNHIVDVEKVYRWFKGSENINADYIGVFGNSMGGAHALYLASKHPEIKAVCAVSTPVSIERVQSLFTRMEEWKETGYWEKNIDGLGVFRLPFSFLEDASCYRIEDHASKVKTPKLFIAGEKDKTVLPEDTKRLYEMALEPKQFIMFENMKHAYRDQPEILAKLNSKVISFFRSTLLENSNTKKD